MSTVRAALFAMTVAVLGIPAGPASLDAQTCLGTPTDAGEVALLGGRSTRGVTTSYGGGFQANLGGAVSLGAGFSVDTFDDVPENGFSSGLSASWLDRFRSVSVCPVFEVEYSQLAAGDDRDDPFESVTLAPGIALGYSMPLARGLSLGAHTRPFLLAVFGSHERIRGGSGIRDPEQAIEAGVTAGVSLRADRLFLGAELLHSTLPNTDPEVLIHLGITQ